MLQKFSGEHVPSEVLWQPFSIVISSVEIWAPLHPLSWILLQSLRLLWQRRSCSVAPTACGGDHVGLGGAGKLELGGPVPKAGRIVLKREKNLSPAPGHSLGYKCIVSHFSRPCWKIPNSEASVHSAMTWIQAQSAPSCVTSGQLLTSLDFTPQFVNPEWW